MALLVIVITFCSLVGFFYAAYKTGRIAGGSSGRLGGTPKWTERAKNPASFWFLFILYTLLFGTLLTGLTYIIFKGHM